MPRCSRKGCGLEFLEGNSETDICTYHPGAPVFHEGLKSWSCCQGVNKPVLDFDDFMKIEGCEELRGHTTEFAVTAPLPKPTPAINLSAGTSPEGTEHFRVGTGTSVLRVRPPSTVPVEPALEVDDLNSAVAVGTVCRRNGCGAKFVSSELNRQGDGDGTICHYHPSPPIFREGSKGYLCCKRRVLEFDEFLKIQGCMTGRHVFAPVLAEPRAEEQVTCRIDHYQTLPQVHVSIFAKQVDRDRSSIHFERDQVILDLYLPGEKRFSKTINLFGHIDPQQSSFHVLGTKVELHLQKADTRSWTVLEKTDRNLGNISLTFGVGGKTGTVGAKEVILDEANKARG